MIEECDLALEVRSTWSKALYRRGQVELPTCLPVPDVGTLLKRVRFGSGSQAYLAVDEPERAAADITKVLQVDRVWSMSAACRPAKRGTLRGRAPSACVRHVQSVRVSATCALPESVSSVRRAACEGKRAAGPQGNAAARRLLGDIKERQRDKDSQDKVSSLWSPRCLLCADQR